MRRHVSSCHLLTVGAALLLGCGSDAPGTEPPAQVEEEIEIFSWWIAPGEAGALDGIIDLYEDRHPGSRVVNAVLADAENSRKTLADRITAGMPPDLYQENARELRKFAMNNPGKLTALEDFYAEHKLRDVLLPELLENVTIDGALVGLPMGIHRANSLFYNKELFDEHGVTPPNSIAELLAVCEKLKMAGVTPFATSHDGWVQNLLFELLHQGVLGTERYRQFMEGDPGSDKAKLPEAVAVYAQILENYTNLNAGDEGFGWSQAADLLFENQAAMYAHGDWAKGYYVQRGWTSDVDFGVVGTPGAADLFMYDLDIWVMPKGGPNPAGARGFLEAAISLEGQLAFDLIKGATPVRSDLPADHFDSIGQSVLQSLRTAEVRGMNPLPTLDDLYVAFLKDHDQAALVAGILEVYEGYRKTL